MHKLARSLDNDAFVKRNLLALSDITSRNELKTIANNYALNTADDHDELHHERKRRFFGGLIRKVKRWGQRTFNRTREVAIRLAAAARRRALWLAAQARAKARRIAEAARRRALWLARRAKRLALAAQRKALAIARKLKAKALAFVNKIKNKFGGFSGVIKAFRMGFCSDFMIKNEIRD